MGENYTGQLLANIIKGKEQAKGSVVGNTPRKGLADISNLPQPNYGLKLQSYSPKTKEYIHKLHQEIVSLTKLLADKIKIIRLHELELQKSKTICLQMRQKNQLFAQTNSQMLEELNSAKDKLKVLQHELGCKNGLLAARNLESGVEPINCDDVRKPSREDKKNNVPCIKMRTQQSKYKETKNENRVDDNRRKSARFKVETEGSTSMVEGDDTLNLTTTKPVQPKLKIDDKRRNSRTKRKSDRLKVEEEKSTATVESGDALDHNTSKPEMQTDDNRLYSRRRSARFRQQEEQVQEQTRDISQADDVEVRVSHLHELGSTPSAQIKFETPECVPGSEDVESQRTSRPKRQATEKVQSYKEIPLNIKMRRRE